MQRRACRSGFWRRLTGLLVVGVLVAAGCGGGSDEVSEPATTPLVRNAVLTTSTSVPATTTTQAPTTTSTTTTTTIALVEVPDLVGQTVDYAEGVLSVLGLVLVVDASQDADGEQRVIFEQLPEAGRDVTPDTPVVVKVPAAVATTTAAPTTTTAVPTTTTSTTVPVTTTTVAPSTTSSAPRQPLDALRDLGDELDAYDVSLLSVSDCGTYGVVAGRYETLLLNWEGDDWQPLSISWPNSNPGELADVITSGDFTHDGIVDFLIRWEPSDGSTLAEGGVFSAHGDCSWGFIQIFDRELDVLIGAPYVVDGVIHGIGWGTESDGDPSAVTLSYDQHNTVFWSDRDELVSSGGWNGCYFDGVPMWGSVYVSDRSLYADFDVYVSDRSLYADLSVYPADRSLYADSCGRWWFTDRSLYADFTVYFTDRSLYADFDVYFTDRALYAGR